MDGILEVLSQKLTDKKKHGECFERYSQLKTDQERVIFTLNLLIDYNITFPIKSEVKNLFQSREFNTKATKSLINNPLNCDFDVIIELYTKSIAYAPGSYELSLAYANRSATLFKAHLYEDCLRDCERALKLNYPDKWKAKLFARKARCLSYLVGPDGSSDPKVAETLEQVRLWLPKMDGKDSGVKLVEKTLNSLHLMSQSEAAFIKLEDERHLPSISADNEEICGATSAVAVEFSEQYGKYVRATRDIKVGEVLAVNEGYATVLMLDKIYTHCTYCLKQTWSAIPCNFCVYAVFCSEECRRDAWEGYHQVECRITGPIVAMEMNHMALMALRLLVSAVKQAGDLQALKDLLIRIDFLADIRKNGFTDGKLDGSKYSSVYTLARNTERRSVPDLFGRSLNAVFITYLLATESSILGEQLKGGLPEVLSHPWATFVGGLVMRHLQIIPSNVHSVTEDNLDQLPIDRAAALMPFYSLFNHSCNPMVDRRSFGKKIAMIAISPIKKGEQIFDNYGQHYAITLKAKRRQKLLQQYHFTCSCQACTESWPLYGSYKSYKDQELSKTVKKEISNALTKLDQYYALATRGDVEDKPEMIENLGKMLKILYKHVNLPCTEVNNVVEIWKKVYSLLGNRLQSLNSDTITTIINI
ncbi:Similar to SMYD4: SET and MYND domain-containing protein 4 (Pongo abelii) [Cotesia congregata]|uniref:Protein-lysine N-methyltransferase SMYD4 n=1 Tax=Cotesia congregata TaxID=51543 RepID=A0A8J2HBK8_COTCN|nr:Similar to SMYD4: SET and MYND domain-containing protein 4 (Pongo abelii) [Cotesia congregata]